MMNLTEEIPYDFMNPSTNDIRVYFINGSDNIEITSGLDKSVGNADADPNKEIYINISDMTATEVGGTLAAGEFIEYVYYTNSSEMEAEGYRVVDTNISVVDVSSNTASDSMQYNITASQVVIRGTKNITVNPADPQNITVAITLFSLGGPLTDIYISDYLPQGASIYDLNVTFYNGSYATTSVLQNGSDYYVEAPSQDTLPDGTYVDIYYYNFTYNYTAWNGSLSNNDTLEIKYNVTVLGGRMDTAHDNRRLGPPVSEAYRDRDTQHNRCPPV